MGVSNYKNDILLNVVEEVQPTQAPMWQIVAQRYQDMSGEITIREAKDIRRHFTTLRNLGTHGKKATKSASSKNGANHREQNGQQIAAVSASSVGVKDEDESNQEFEDDSEDSEDNPNDQTRTDAVPFMNLGDISNKKAPQSSTSSSASTAPPRDPSPVPGQKRLTPLEYESIKSGKSGKATKRQVSTSVVRVSDAYSKNQDAHESTEMARVLTILTQMQTSMVQIQQQMQLQQTQHQTMMMMMLMGQQHMQRQGQSPQSATSKASSPHPDNVPPDGPDDIDHPAPPSSSSELPILCSASVEATSQSGNVPTDRKNGSCQPTSSSTSSDTPSSIRFVTDESDHEHDDPH